MFPEITHIDQLRAAVGHKEEIRFSEQPNGTTVVCYMVADRDTFDNALARECRGITFDAQGKLICRPLHKFFNLNENAATQEHALPWDMVQVLMDKVDGSMLTPLILNGELLWKSKKSFDSDVAKMAADHARTQPKLELFAKDWIAKGYTPIFEFVSPDARIVVGYPKPELRLLHLRHMQSGNYLVLHNADGSPTDMARELCEEYELTLVECLPIEPVAQVLEKLTTARNLEGVIFRFADGEMVKVKCPWYLTLHHSITFIRERDIAALVLDEKLDDVKASLFEIGATLESVEAVEQRVVDELNGIRHEVDELVAQYHGKTPKEMALACKSHPLFGLAIQQHRGNEPDYLEYFRKSRLKEYSLRQLPMRPVEVDFSG